MFPVSKMRASEAFYQMDDSLMVVTTLLPTADWVLVTGLACSHPASTR